MFQKGVWRLSYKWENSGLSSVNAASFLCCHLITACNCMHEKRFLQVTDMWTFPCRFYDRFYVINDPQSACACVWTSHVVAGKWFTKGLTSLRPAFTFAHLLLWPVQEGNFDSVKQADGFYASCRAGVTCRARVSGYQGEIKTSQNSCVNLE